MTRQRTFAEVSKFWTLTTLISTVHASKFLILDAIYYDAFPYKQIFGYKYLIFQVLFQLIKIAYTTAISQQKKKSLALNFIIPFNQLTLPQPYSSTLLFTPDFPNKQVIIQSCSLDFRRYFQNSSRLSKISSSCPKQDFSHHHNAVAATKRFFFIRPSLS